MRIQIDLQECVKDSPKFRAHLESAESTISSLEIRLEKIIKLCSAMIDAGKAYGAANSAFISGVQDLATHFQGDEVVEKTIARFTGSLSELQGFHRKLIDHVAQSIIKEYQRIIRVDLKTVKDAQREFRRASDDFEGALNRHSAAPRSKPAECEEAAALLAMSSIKFKQASLDYSYQLNVFTEKERHDTLSTLFSYLAAQSTYFHQGHDMFSDLESFMKKASAQMVELSDKVAAVSRKNLGAEDNSKAQPEKVEGFLFRKKAKGFKSWVRRWFLIDNNQLMYTKHLSDGWTVIEDDLRLCAVKPYIDSERRFCFEVKSPTRSHILQAADSDDCTRWVSALHAAVLAAYRDRSMRLSGEIADLQTPAKSSTDSLLSSKTESQLKLIYMIPGNNVCADCSSAEPRWASCNLGVTLCIACSGVHRGLGVHISKVRSLNLDSWEPEVLKVMAELGNEVVNRIFENTYNAGCGIVRPNQDSSNAEREVFIRAKYVDRRFVKPLLASDKCATITRWTVAKRNRKTLLPSDLPPADAVGADSLVNADGSVSQGDVVLFGTSVNNSVQNIQHLLPFEDEAEGNSSSDDAKSHTSLEDVEKLDANLLLYKAAEARNIPVMLEALANRALIDWQNPSDSNQTPLIRAVQSGSLAACEFLLLNSARVDIADSSNRPPLHHATTTGHTAQVCQLLKRGANHKHQDATGTDALTLAVKSEQADIVTLLRVAGLRQEMFDADPSTLSDDMFNDVFRDFTNLASNEPDKLKRNVLPAT